MSATALGAGGCSFRGGVEEVPDVLGLAPGACRSQPAAREAGAGGAFEVAGRADLVGAAADCAGGAADFAGGVRAGGAVTAVATRATDVGCWGGSDCLAGRAVASASASTGTDPVTRHRRRNSLIPITSPPEMAARPVRVPLTNVP
jgi:hypothetical protein